MKHTLKKEVRGPVYAQCKKCGKWFPINKTLEGLIIDGIIHPIDIVLCYDCAEAEEEQVIFEAELECILNNL